MMIVGDFFAASAQTRSREDSLRNSRSPVNSIKRAGLTLERAVPSFCACSCATTGAETTANAAKAVRTNAGFMIVALLIIRGGDVD